MGSSERMIELIVQVLLGLAVLSFLEYSIRTLHQPEAVNRRAKLICAAGLTLGVLGAWVTLYAPPFGVAMVIAGNGTAVVTMIWLEKRARQNRRVKTKADRAA